MSKNIHATQDWVRDNLGIKPTASGELISLSDSAEAPLQSMKIFGKTQQTISNGHQMLGAEIAGDSTVLFNDDGTVTAEPRDNGELSVIFIHKDVIQTWGDKRTLYLTIEPVNGEPLSESSISIILTDSEYSTLKSTVLSSGSTYKAKIQYELAEEDTGSGIGLAIIFMDENIDFVTYKVMLTDVYDATWEPYTGGIPSPNPDYPQELVSVGDSGSMTEYVMGGNLISDEVYDYNNWVAYEGDSGRYYWLNLPEGVYTVSANSTGKNNYFYVYKMINGAPMSTNTHTLLFNGKDSDSYTFTVAKGDVYGFWTNAPYLPNVFDIQLEAGSVATPYEPYTEQSLTIQTPNGLPGIPVSSGGNYTDSNGQQYVCDEVDFERGVYVQRVVKKICNGTESWQPSTGTGAAYRYFISRLGAVGSVISNACMCTHYVTTTISSSTTTIGINLVNSDSYGSAQLNLRPDNASNITVSELSVLLAENPITVYYALTTPIETPLTEEEIQAYKALHTNYPNTTIYNSDGAGAEVEYGADTKNYIDNKIAELEANILKATE